MTRSARDRDTVALAGWLFADLLLGISMLFLVAGTKGKLQTATPTMTLTMMLTHTATATATPTLTPTPTPTVTPSATPTITPTDLRTPTPSPRPGGLEQHWDEIELKADMDLLLGKESPAKLAEEERVRQMARVKLEPFAGRRAGMVLAFGATKVNEPTRGTQLAARVTELLKESMPTEMFATAVMKPYHDLLTEKTLALRGTVTMEIYWIRD